MKEHFPTSYNLLASISYRLSVRTSARALCVSCQSIYGKLDNLGKVLTYDDVVPLAHPACVLASQVDLSEPIFVLSDPEILAWGTWITTTKSKRRHRASLAENADLHITTELDVADAPISAWKLAVAT